MTATFAHSDLRSSSNTAAATGLCAAELLGLTDVHSFGNHISNVCRLTVPLDVVRIAADKSIRSCAVIWAEVTDNCTTWARPMMSKACLSTKASCIRISNVISCSSMLGVVGVSDRDAVTYSLDNSVEGWSVLGSHIIKILREMAM